MYAMAIIYISSLLLLKIKTIHIIVIENEIKFKVRQNIVYIIV